jgi:hypothetical protein
MVPHGVEFWGRRELFLSSSYPQIMPSNTSNTSRKASAVTTTPLPTELLSVAAGLSSEDLTKLVADLKVAAQAAQAAKAAAKAAAKVAERIPLSVAAKVAADSLGWKAPFVQGVKTIRPQDRDRFNITSLSPLYDMLGRLILVEGSVTFGTIAELYANAYADSKVREFGYILQQVANRMGKLLNVEAGRVTIYNG